MSYLSALGLHKEPFSTSPDPHFFYRSDTHRAALARLEIAIRLKRGLSIVLGDIGTGKTTLARTLIRSFKDEEPFEFYMLFDPSFSTEFQFLSMLTDLFKIKPVRQSTVNLKRAIENFLYDKNLNQNKTVVLIIDESQKLPLYILEILRVFLNYETNEYKLIQVVLFSQTDILSKLISIKNFYDRIGLKYFLKPLGFLEIQELIEYRLNQAGWPSHKRLFTPDAVHKISDYSNGLLRKITYLCHQALLKYAMVEPDVIDQTIIEDVILEEEEFLNAWRCNTRREVTQAY